jgi:hypothetical protein
MAEEGAGGSGNGSSGEMSRLQLLQEMRQQNFDTIRFASYRTACKLRFIQKKVHRKYSYSPIIILLYLFNDSRNDFFLFLVTLL